MQIARTHRGDYVSGYGVVNFEAGAVKDGVIIEHEKLAHAAHEMFKKNLIGNITTRRVVLAVPASRTFTRIMSLPKIKDQDLTEAMRLEAEQYIPLPLNELYMDNTIIARSKDHIEVLTVAAPKRLVDSYVLFAQLLGLEVAAIETTISAAGRLFLQTDQSALPTVLIDLGSLSTDITIYDNGLVVTGTVPGGGDSVSALIAEKLSVNKQEAHIIKSKYGLDVSKKQKDITEALRPLLDQLVKEVRRMIRYYEERSNTDRKISQVVTMGGGANMPGLATYLTSHLRLPVRMCDPWQNLNFKELQPPGSTEKSMYITVAGLSLVNPREIFA